MLIDHKQIQKQKVQRAPQGQRDCLNDHAVSL
jgi:hypothetical protein